MSEEKNVWQILGESWPSPIITRSELGKFSGGLLRPATVRNLDSMGQGIRRFKVGRKTCYLVKDVIDWLQARSMEQK